MNNLTQRMQQGLQDSYSLINDWERYVKKNGSKKLARKVRTVFHRRVTRDELGAITVEETMVTSETYEIFQAEVKTCWNSFSTTLNEQPVHKLNWPKVQDALRNCICGKIASIAETTGGVALKEHAVLWKQFKCSV